MVQFTIHFSSMMYCLRQAGNGVCMGCLILRHILVGQMCMGLTAGISIFTCAPEGTAFSVELCVGSFGGISPKGKMPVFRLLGFRALRPFLHCLHIRELQRPLCCRGKVLNCSCTFMWLLCVCVSVNQATKRCHFTSFASAQSLGKDHAGED